MSGSEIASLITTIMEKEIGYFRIAKEEENKMWIYAGIAMGASLIQCFLPIEGFAMSLISVLLTAVIGFSYWFFLKEYKKGYLDNSSDSKQTLFQIINILLFAYFGCYVLGGLIGLTSAQAGNVSGALSGGLFMVLGYIFALIFYVSLILLGYDLKGRFGGQLSLSGLIIMISVIVVGVFMIFTFGVGTLFNVIKLIGTIAIFYSFRAGLKSE